MAPTRAPALGGHLLLACALTLLTAPAWALTPPFVPSPFQLNQSEPCHQRSPEVATLANGDLMAVWIGNVGEEFGIVGRRLSRSGAPRGDELALEVPPGVRMGSVQIAALPDGGFLLAWGWSDGEMFADSHLALSRFDAAGEFVLSFNLGASLDVDIHLFGLAVDGLGRAAVAWSDGEVAWLRLFDAELNSAGGIRPVGQPAAPGDVIGAVDVARTAGGATMVVWEEGDAGEPFRFESIRGRAFDPGGGFAGGPFTVNQISARSLGPGSLSPSIAASSSSGFVVAWANQLASGIDTGVYAQELSAAGSPLGSSFQVNSDPLFGAETPEVVATTDGGYAVVWTAHPPYPPVDPLPPGFDPVVRGRRFGAGGVPAGGDFQLWTSPEGRLQSTPAAAFSQGRLVQVWRDHYPFPVILPPPCSEDSKILAMDTSLACTPTATRLCLQGGRFAVDVRLRPLPTTPPTERTGFAVPLTDDTGTFWFFRPANVELMVKVLDGRPVNSRFWFFSGALSNVEYTIRVTDTQTGVARDYPSEGRLVSLVDTSTFFDPPPPPFAPVAGPAGVETSGEGGLGSFAAATHPLASCAGPEVLCLHDGRFRARISWADPRSGDRGLGFGVNLTDESGYFWFFRDSNAEVIFKLLDGTPVNGFYWTFVGGLTDVAFTLIVEDTEQHRFWIYENPPFVLQSRADTRALPDEAALMTRSAQGNGLP